MTTYKKLLDQRKRPIRGLWRRRSCVISHFPALPVAMLLLVSRAYGFCILLRIRQPA
jgi:hypothetical protein